MNDLILSIDSILYILFAAVIWLLGRVVVLIEKTTRNITRLTVVVHRAENDLSDHELRLRTIEQEKNNE